MTQYRHLDIDPLERAARYKRFYGGLVFDKLYALGVGDTMFSQKIRALRQDMVLAGYAPVSYTHLRAHET